MEQAAGGRERGGKDQAQLPAESRRQEPKPGALGTVIWQGQDTEPRSTPRPADAGAGQLAGPHPDPQGLTAVCRCSVQGAGDTPRVFTGDRMLAATSTHQCEPALLVCFEVQLSPSLVNIPKRGFALPRCCSQVERPTGEKKKKKEHARSRTLLWFYFQNCSLVKSSNQSILPALHLGRGHWAWSSSFHPSLKFWFNRAVSKEASI